MANLLERLVRLDIKITNLMTGLLPGDDAFDEIQLQSRRLADRISDAINIEATNAEGLYINGNATLMKTLKRLAEDIRSLADLQANIEAITGVIDTATEFIAAIAPVPLAED